MKTPKIRVFLIDDAATRRAFLSHALVQWGAQVEVFESGDKAKDELNRLDTSQYPDLIASDVHMPGLDGVALRKLLQTNPYMQRIPVLLYTSLRTDAKDRKENLSSKDFSYLKEAIDFDQIVPALQARIRNLELERKLSAARDLFEKRSRDMTF